MAEVMTMGLSARDRQTLASIEADVAASAPKLTSMLAMFTQLTVGEAMPAGERLRRGRPRRARPGQRPRSAQAGLAGSPQPGNGGGHPGIFDRPQLGPGAAQPDVFGARQGGAQPGLLGRGQECLRPASRSGRQRAGLLMLLWVVISLVLVAVAAVTSRGGASPCARPAVLTCAVRQPAPGTHKAAVQDGYSPPRRAAAAAAARLPAQPRPTSSGLRGDQAGAGSPS